MIVLDTNVLSELMKPAPEPAVVSWLDAQAPNSVWTTSITVFEIRFGLFILPDGKKRRALSQAFEDVLEMDLGGRVLDLDSPAALEAAAIASRLRKSGRPVDFRDGLIAGITGARQWTLATRNARHFEETGVALVDPWNAG